MDLKAVGEAGKGRFPLPYRPFHTLFQKFLKGDIVFGKK
jgi:hypothetical protein